MLHIVRRVLMASPVALCLAAQAQAEPGIDLHFDGISRHFIPQMEGARTGFTRFLSVDAVSMEGADGRAQLVLELSLPPGARPGDAPHDARISYRPDGWRDYWVSPLDFPDGAVTLTELDLSGPDPRIAGQFTVPLCFTRSPVHPPDPDRCQIATGLFDTPLVPD